MHTFIWLRILGNHDGDFQRRFEALSICREAGQTGHDKDVSALMIQKSSFSSGGDRNLVPAL